MATVAQFTAALDDAAAAVASGDYTTAKQHIARAQVLSAAVPASTSANGMSVAMRTDALRQASEAVAAAELAARQAGNRALFQRPIRWVRPGVIGS